MPHSGLYDRAYKFLLFPLIQINVPLARVMLPTLARLRTDEERYRSAYLQALNQLLLVTQPGVVFAIATADIFVPIVLGENWRAAAPIFQWLGLRRCYSQLAARRTGCSSVKGAAELLPGRGHSTPQPARLRSALACHGGRLVSPRPIQFLRFYCGRRSCCG